MSRVIARNYSIFKPIRLVAFYCTEAENVLDLTIILGEGTDYAMSKMRQQ